MTKIAINKLLSPTYRKIKNLKSNFTTSDGPNTSAFLSLDDIGIPYDSHYVSRIILPADSTDFYLNYGLSGNTTFLLIKVTYNGNYDFPMEDSLDPLYFYEPNNYNITYYFDDNSGKTYPIGRLLILNGSFNNKLNKIYLNNPLSYDVVLDVLAANIVATPSPILPSNSAITVSNLFYSNIITDQVFCVNISGVTTGSTSFIINTLIPNIPTGYTTSQYIIPYNSILSIQKVLSINSSGGFGIIYLYTTITTYTLNFLIEFECNNAFSRMMFAYTSFLDNSCRWL